MKTISLVVASCIVMTLNSNCSSGGSEQENNASIPKTLSDSLYKATMEGHDIGMAKMGEMMRCQKLVQQRIDSVSNLKNQDSQIADLDSALKSLNDAEEQMNRWMQDFEPDKAGDTEEEKVLFYKDEKAKIDTVNARIFRSIDHAKRVLE
ncbi:MAG: hypothetical protein M9933_11430 [Chitinophagaceae bacterium]|nr:hypothetical protein [Chitinophagaceae bacterium]